MKKERVRFFFWKIIIFILLIIYFLNFSIVHNHVDYGFGVPDVYLTSAKLILEENRWPVFHYFEQNPPNLVLFFTFIASIVGLKLESVYTAVIFLNIGTILFIWFHCRKQKYCDPATVLLLIFCMFHPIAFMRGAVINHTVVSVFFLVGGFVFLANFNAFDSPKYRKAFLFLSGFCLGFAANSRIPYVLAAVFCLLWLAGVQHFDKTRNHSQRGCFIFVGGIFLASSYSIVAFISDPVRFYLMHISINYYIENFIAVDPFRIVQTVIFDFLLTMQCIIILSFVIPSTLICFTSQVKQKESPVNLLFQSNEARIQFLALGFVVTTIAPYISIMTSERLSESVYFLALAGMPFLQRCYSDGVLKKYGSKAICFILGTTYVLTFFLFDFGVNRTSPYLMLKNPQKSGDHFSKVNISKVRRAIRENLEDGGIAFIDDPVIFTDMPFRFVPGAEFPQWLHFTWEHQVPREVTERIHLISRFDFENQMKEEVSLMVLLDFPKGKNMFQPFANHYFDLVEAVGSWKIYTRKITNGTL